MSKLLLLIMLSFLALSTFHTSAFAIPGPLNGETKKTWTRSATTEIHDMPHIVVDGNLSDWTGLYPVTNGTSGMRDYNFYGITECYVLVDRGSLYFVFQKKPGGSDSWQMFFDTDLSSQTGYPINGIEADYRLSLMDRAFYEWSGNTWEDSNISLQVDYDTLHGGAKTADSSVIYAYGSGGGGRSPEWFEGKISLSVLGNPAMFGLVFQLPLENLVAPETGHIVVSQSQNISFAASYTSRPILHYGQPTHMVFNLLNFGPANLVTANLTITLPSDLNLTSGQTSWRGAIPAGERLAQDFAAEPLNYDRAVSYSNFSWTDPSSGKSQALSISSTTLAVPSVSLKLEAPKDMIWGIEYSMNVTVSNLDPLSAPLIIEPDPSLYTPFSYDRVSLILSPNSTAQLLLQRVTPTSIGQQTIGIRARYQNVSLASASVWGVMVRKPQVYLASVNMTNKMQMDETYFISTIIRNQENLSCTITASIEPSKRLLCLNSPNVSLTLPPASNTTVIFQIKPQETGSSYATMLLANAYGNIESEYFNIDVESAPIVMLILYAAMAVVALILAVVIVLRRKTISQKLRGSAR